MTLFITRPGIEGLRLSRRLVSASKLQAMPENHSAALLIWSATCDGPAMRIIDARPVRDY